MMTTSATTMLCHQQHQQHHPTHKTTINKQRAKMNKETVMKGQAMSNNNQREGHKNTDIMDAVVPAWRRAVPWVVEVQEKRKLPPSIS